MGYILFHTCSYNCVACSTVPPSFTTTPHNSPHNPTPKKYQQTPKNKITHNTTAIYIAHTTQQPLPFTYAHTTQQPLPQQPLTLHDTITLHDNQIPTYPHNNNTTISLTSDLLKLSPPSFFPASITTTPHHLRPREHFHLSPHHKLHLWLCFWSVCLLHCLE